MNWFIDCPSKNWWLIFLAAPQIIPNYLCCSNVFYSQVVLTFKNAWKCLSAWINNICASYFRIVDHCFVLCFDKSDFLLTSMTMLQPWSISISWYWLGQPRIHVCADWLYVCDEMWWWGKFYKWRIATLWEYRVEPLCWSPELWAS